MEAIPIHKDMLLHVIPSDKFMTDTLCLLIRRPLNREEVTANALLASVLGRGSALYPTQTEIALATEKMSGSLFESQIIKKGEQQILQYYFEGIHDDAALPEAGLSFLREMMLQPLTEGEGFHAEYVRGESGHLKDQIEARINQKSEYAKLECLSYMCEGEPFGLYGDGYTEDLKDITPTGLFHQYKKMIATSPIDFIAVGRWDGEKLCEQLSTLFSVYRDDTAAIPPAQLKPGRGDPRVERLDTGSTQGNLCMGLRGEISPVGESFIYFQLANEILGGGANAKLFAHVREKESLCYHIQSHIYRFKGLLCIQCGAEASQFDRIVALINEQIDALKRGEITDEEIDNAKRAITKRWRSLQDYPSGSIDFYASQYLLGDDRTLDGLTEQLASAGRDGIVEIANRLTTDTLVMAQ